MVFALEALAKQVMTAFGMRTRYLIIFAQAHHEFRIPELLSIAELNGFLVTLPPAEYCDTTQPFMTVELDEAEHARLLCRRCILIRLDYSITLSFVLCTTQ
jgi:tRNA (guanine10-N2)-methyltransferase